MSERNKTAETRFSITRKLNTKLFFRLLGIFFSFNFIICIIAGVGIALYCELEATHAVRALERYEQPGDAAWIEKYGMTAREIPASDRPNPGFRAFPPLTRLLPDETRDAVRGFRAEPDGFHRTVRSITFVLYTERGGAAYELELNIGRFIYYFIFGFLTLLAIEFLTIISRTLDDRRMVRRTLDPITELARAAQSLHDVGNQLYHDKMTALTGRLDGIDANALDVRIQVDDLQEELKNLAVAINGMLDRINESYAAQARFVSDASHELRTPIAVIQGYANLLDRWGKEDEKALLESVAAIKDEAGNMKDLVEQLLFLARGDSNTIRLEEELVDLSGLVEEVAGEMRMLDSGHEFKVNNADSAVMADRALIKQALRILVDNAVKYTDPGGEITIASGRGGGFARLSVTDDGVGIRPETIPRVFDRFVRADESRARATGGAGLGLSIAQWIAARHNGHIEILSREGVGTRVVLALPAAPGAAATDINSAEADGINEYTGIV